MSFKSLTRSLGPSLRSSTAAAPSSTASQILRPATTLAAGVPRVPSRTPTKYGGVYTVTLIPGDGIGKEITGSVKEVFSAMNVPIEWEEYDVSGETHGSERLFNEALESLRRNKVGLKGILYTPIDATSHNSWNVAMRQRLDIYASLTLCKTLPGFPTRHKDVDIVIVRENTEGEYSGLEHSVSRHCIERERVTI